MNKVDRRQIAYTGYAPQYDARRVEGVRNEYLERIRRQALLRAIGGVPLEARVLDVGCGTGRGPVSLARHGFADITAVDFTEAMLAQAQAKVRRLDSPDAVRLIRGDAYKLPFADGTFDLVVSLRFVHMFRFDLQQELVREMARVCRPGGLVAIELESIHKGLFISRYWEQRKLKTHQKFNSRREVRQMFSPDLFRDHRVFGAVLPRVYTLFERWPSLGERVESLAFVPPFNWMANEIVVAGRRRPNGGAVVGAAR